MSGSNKLLRLLFAVLPAVTLFAIADYCASYAVRPPAFATFPRSEYIEYDPLQMWRLRPGFTMGDIAISPEGFRGASPARDSGERLVFVLGGSTVFGVGVPQEETVVHYLQELTDRDQPGQRYRFINAGVTAYYSTQELIHLERHVLEHQPAMVIELTGRNDAFYGLHPRYSPDTIPYHGLLREQMGALDPYYTTLEQPPPQLHIVAWLRGRLPEKPFNWLADFEEVKLQYKPAATEVFLRNVEAMHSLLQGKGVPFHSFLQPTLRVPPRTLSPEEEELPVDFYLDALDAAYADLAHASEQQLSPDWFHGFARLSGAPGQRFIDNVHFNREGAREAAEAIHAQIFAQITP